MQRILALTFVAFVAAITFGMAVSGGSNVSVNGPVATLQVHSAVIVQASSTANSTGINGTSIWNTLWNDASGFLSTILKGFENLLSDIFGGIGASIEEVFQGWGYTLVQQTGIFAPVVMVAILSLSFFVLQMFAVLFSGEKDVEEEVEAA